MKKSFTLIELVTSIFVIIVALGGIYLAIQQLIVATSFLPNQLIATYLAQEGIEVIRNIRDTNWIKGEENWKSGLEGYNSEQEGCDIPNGANLSYDSLSLEIYQNLPLYIYNNFYRQTTLGKETSFKRRIVINSKTDEKGIEYLEVISYVCWRERGRTHQTKLIENLYNWY